MSESPMKPLLDALDSLLRSTQTVIDEAQGKASLQLIGRAEGLEQAQRLVQIAAENVDKQFAELEQINLTRAVDEAMRQLFGGLPHMH